MKKNLVLCTLFLGLSICAYSQLDTNNLPKGKKVPELMLQRMDGQVDTMPTGNGEVLVLNFWNIGCKGCLLEQPTLNKIKDDFEGEPVRFLSITLNEQENLTDYLEKHPINWDIIGGVDFMGLVIKESNFFNVRAMPTTIIIGFDQEVKYSSPGMVFETEDDPFLVALRESLAKKQ